MTISKTHTENVYVIAVLQNDSIFETENSHSQ